MTPEIGRPVMTPLTGLWATHRLDPGSQERPYKTFRSAPRGLRSRLRGEDDTVLAEGGRGRDDGGKQPPKVTGAAAADHPGVGSSSGS